MSVKKDELSLRGAGHGTAREGYETHSDVVLIYGDLHLSGVYEGTHKDYQENCRRVMRQLLTQVREYVNNGKTVSVIFLGDVFGVKERNIKDHGFLTQVVMFFQELNLLCKDEVYSVRGNHDFGASGGYPDFALFEVLQCIRNPRWVDFKPGGGETQVRFHLVNYGAEDNELELLYKDDSTDASDVILAHNDFKVDGETAWYGDTSLDLKHKTNFIGAKLLISGHIHTPTDFISCTIGSVWDITLFYPGCPTRVSERYDDCRYIEFYKDGDDTQFNALMFGLWPAEEEFHPKNELTTDEMMQQKADVMRNKLFEELFEEMQNNNIHHGDVTNQINNHPAFSEQSKEIARKYMEEANS